MGSCCLGQEALVCEGKLFVSFHIGCYLWVRRMDWWNPPPALKKSGNCPNPKGRYFYNSSHGQTHTSLLLLIHPDQDDRLFFKKQFLSRGPVFFIIVGQQQEQQQTTKWEKKEEVSHHFGTENYQYLACLALYFSSIRWLRQLERGFG